jgi:CBS domain containing-hemolysin-like protein
MNVLIPIAVILILIGFNALYVAAEFSSVSGRRARLAQLADEGNSSARLLLPIVEDGHKLDTFIAACQIGITLSSLILGFYGQASLASLLFPLLMSLGSLSAAVSQSLAATIVLVFLTVLQVVLGELVPKNIGVQYPERLALATVRPVRWSIALFRPLIWLFNGSGRAILRLLRLDVTMEHAHVHAPEEILMLVEESGAAGILQAEEQRLLENTLRLRKLLVRQVMIPRTQMLAEPVEQSVETLLEIVANSPYSRVPLYEGNIDNIVGLVHLKDLFCMESSPAERDVRRIMRNVEFIYENMPVDEAFALLQRQHAPLAIVLDEYGGTAGIVTLEDLIEEIFGELSDEFDVTAPAFQPLSDRRVLVRGDVLVDEVNETLGLDLPTTEADSIGGLVVSQLSEIPRKHQTTTIGGVELRVESVTSHRVDQVSLVVPEKIVKQLRDGRS